MENPWKVIAAFIGVFIAGAVFGGFFSLGIGARWMATHPAATSVSTPAPAPVATTTPSTSGAPAPTAANRPLLPVPLSWQAPQLLRHYADRLSLTPEQKERITPLIRRAIEDYRRVQQTTFRETGIILQRLQEDLAKELTPEQRDKLEEMKRKQLERQREVFQKLERQREQRKAGATQREKPATEPASPAATPSTPTTTAPAEPAPAAAAEATSTPSKSAP